MKKLLFALVLSAAGGVFAEVTGNYVQDGLVAMWDGYENTGVKGVHATELTEWKDLVGQRSFAFAANSTITVDGSALKFPGNTSTGYATLDAVGTDATFEAAKNGTFEIVLKSDATTVQNVALQSSPAASISIGALARASSSANATLLFDSPSSRPTRSYNWSVGTNTFAALYTSALSQSVYANGSALAAGSNDGWSGSDNRTFLGMRSAGSQAFTGRIFAIRLYSRHLTAAEIAANRAVDEARFIAGDVASPPSAVLEISTTLGIDPGVTPACGRVTGLADGSQVSCSAPAAYVTAKGARYKCTGYRLYDISPEYVITEVSGSPFAGTSCAYVHGTSRRRLVWQYENVTVFCVAQEGIGEQDGTDWNNAMGSLQDALDAAGRTGVDAVVKVKEGDYPLSRMLSLTNATAGAKVTVRGGYTGVGETIGVARSVLYRRSDAGAMRIFLARNATLEMANLAVTNGLYSSDATYYGMAMYLDGCATVMTNCAVRENWYNGSLKSGQYYGAIYATGGSMHVDACDISENGFYTPNAIHYLYGGVGLCVRNGAATTILNTRFDRNRAKTVYCGFSGMALNVADSSLVVSNCTFTGNYDWRTENYGPYSNTFGGAFYYSANSTCRCEFYDTLFERNWHNGLKDPGGCLYVSHPVAKGGTYGTVFNRCIFKDNGMRPIGDTICGKTITTAYDYDNGDVYIGSGYPIGMTNCVFVGTDKSDMIRISSGQLLMHRCTIANARVGYGLHLHGGSATLTDSIVWGNAKGGIYADAGASFSATYSDLQEPISATGNFSADPLLSTNGWAHLLSEAGYYDACFTGGVWRVAETNSLAVDAGNPDLSTDLEPQPNRHLPNIGGYAGTEVATKTKLAADPIVRANELKLFFYDITPGAGAATVRGEVASTGSPSVPDANVSVVWDSADRGTADKSDWAHSQAVGSYAPWTLFTSDVSGLSGETVFRLYAETDTQRAFSDPLTYVPVDPATISTATVSRVQRTTAYATAAISDDGGVPTTTLRVRVYPSSATEASAVTFDFNFGAAVAVGTTYDVTVTGLEPGTEYVFLIEAVNTVGVTQSSLTRTTHSVAARTFYVSPTGAGDLDGSSAANAFGCLQDAIQCATSAGDSITMAPGTYNTCRTDISEVSSYLSVFDAPGLTVNGDPDGGTLITIASDEKRLLYVSGSTAAFNDITFKGGRLNQAGMYGMGVRSVGSAVTFTRCVFDDNGAPSATGEGHWGGAFAADGGSARFVDCVIKNNRISINLGQRTIGAPGIWAENTALEIAGCLFATNVAYNGYFGGYGGALYAKGGSVLITNSVFRGNVVKHETNYGVQAARTMPGSAFYFNGVPNALVVDTLFDGNVANNWWGGHTDRAGGVGWIEGASGVTKISRCVFRKNGISPQADNLASGALTHTAGTALIENCLFDGGHSNAVEVTGGTLSVVNTTIVGNDATGLAQWGGTATVKNSILWGNTNGVMGAYTATYSDIQGATPDPTAHVISADPKFKGGTTSTVQPSTFNLQPYHLRSSSPCINAGDATGLPADATDLSGNPRVRSGGLDLGCYEDTLRGLLLLVK